MTAAETIGFVLALLVMIVGLAGAVLPALPGTPVVFVAALVHKLVFGDHSVAWWVIVVLAAMMGLSLALDFAATALGARRLGATWRGVLGAGLGAVLGLFWAPFGLIIGPLAGAILLEMAGGREWREAGRAGVGAVLGFLAGTVGKVACCFAMIGLFTLTLLLHLVTRT